MLLRRLSLALLIGLAWCAQAQAAHVIVGLACETSTDTGDTIDLDGALSGWRTFADAGVASGDTFDYQITSGGKHGEGVGTFTDGTPDTFNRDDAEHSTDGDTTPLTLSGTTIICAGPASRTLRNVDRGDITTAGGFESWAIDANSVALTTDTTGNYAAGDAEAGAALTGDSATSFFSTGTIEDARIAGSAEVDEVLNSDLGDFTCSAGSCTVDANSIALTTDTTGNYAAGDAEAGAALTGDSATSFFSAGTIEDARIDGSAEADEVLNSDKGDFTCTTGTCTVDANSIALTTDTTGNYAAGDAEAGAATTGDSATSFWATGTCEVARGCTGQATEAEALGEMTQALTEQTTPEPFEDFVPIYDADNDDGRKVALKNLTGASVIASATVSGASTLEIVLTNFATCQGFKLFISDYRSSVDDASLNLRLDSNAGASYDAGASDYGWFLFFASATDTALLDAEDSADTEISLGSYGNATSDIMNMELDMWALSSTTANSTVRFMSGNTNSAGNSSFVNGVGNRLAAQDTDAFQLSLSSGTFSFKYRLMCFM
jgi:hypothetical protein